MALQGLTTPMLSPPPGLGNGNGPHATLAGFATAQQYKDEFDSCDRKQRLRRELEHELLTKYGTLLDQVNQLSLDLSSERQSRRQLQEQLADMSRLLSEQNQIVNSNPFVFAILDGDGAIFHDKFYAAGKEGGPNAASLLLDDIRQHLKTLYPDENVAAWDVVVQIVLNLDGLSRKLVSCGVTRSMADLSDFVTSFSTARSLFSFVDVGAGKERADHKIRETLRLMVRIVQCRHVLFGPCHDNGYIPVLAHYKGDHAVQDRLSLLETIPALSDFVILGFHRVSFPSVFRQDALPPSLYNPSSRTYIPPSPSLPLRTVTPSNLLGPPSSASLASPEMNAMNPPKVLKAAQGFAVKNGSDSTWATIGNNSHNNDAMIDINTNRRPPPMTYYLLNKDNKRVDTPLTPKDVSMERKFYSRMNQFGKFCNRHHLVGGCDSEDLCGYYHGDRLPPGELLVLRHKARNIRCPSGTHCQDAHCVLGHICRITSLGQVCTYETCAFKDTHQNCHMPTKRVYEDGSDDLIL